MNLYIDSIIGATLVFVLGLFYKWLKTIYHIINKNNLEKFLKNYVSKVEMNEKYIPEIKNIIIDEVENHFISKIDTKLNDFYMKLSDKIENSKS